MIPPGLFRWLAAMPGAHVGPVRVGPSECGMGGGLYLTERVSDGDLLFAVPHSAVMSVEAAFADPRLGTGLAALSESDGDRAALAGFVASKLLASDARSPYLATLPARSAVDPQHMLWWGRDEVSLLEGTGAHRECLRLREEVDEVAVTLSGDTLQSDVGRCGQQAVDEAVRAAYVSILSRAFTIDAGGAGVGAGAPALIPLLDTMQHSAHATVRYSYGEGRRVEVFAVGGHAAGAEMTICYGTHPDMVFGAHYGFVPAAQAASCYTVLRLNEVDAALFGIGAGRVLDAQRAAETQANDDRWTDERVRATPFAALAGVLAFAGTAAEYPLEFGVSVDDLAGAGSPALRTLCICARLCALPDDGSGSGSTRDQTAAALSEMLLSDTFQSVRCDEAGAAALVVAAAQRQMRLLKRGGEKTADASSQPESLRPDCVRMAAALRRSEAVVLRRLCSSAYVVTLFNGL